ncbi:ABC transporter permease [Nocardia sp. NPDC059691]|uniref:ABC transporter permease n=1 Tax=Nocardia sp. NPDC059691 TaxID=3346908 RepID=UPI0036A8053F
MTVVPNIRTGSPVRFRSVPWPVWPAAVVLLLIVVAAVAPHLLTGVDPAVNDWRVALHPPSPSHPFGTDRLGRDVYSRTVYAARTSLGIGVAATAIAVALGSVVGLLASGPSKLIDAVLMRLTEILLAFPGLLLALVLIAVSGPGARNSALAIGLAATPYYARLVRSQGLVVRISGYVEAARTLGQSRWRITVRHILPNALAPLLVLAPLGVGTGIIAGAGLSFLGLGAVPPTPEWGSMLAESRNLLSRAWWLGVFPGLFVVAAVVSITVLARFWQGLSEGRVAR